MGNSVGNLLHWTITHLFGSHPANELSSSIKAAIQIFLETNPNASRDSVIAYVASVSTKIVADVAHLFPAWGQVLITQYLTHEESTLVGHIYDQVIADLGQVSEG